LKSRLSDLADQVAQLASADEEWRQLVDELRDFAAVCMRVHGGLRKPFTKAKWDSFSVRLQRKKDHYHRPFTTPSEEVSDDSGQQIP
jgi:hypothetical protein